MKTDNLNKYLHKRILIIGTGFLGSVLKNRLELLGANVDSTFFTQQKFPESIRYNLFIDEPNLKFQNEYDFIFLPTKLELEVDNELLTVKLTNFLEYFTQSKIVYISSDGIFSGEKGLYRESDTPNPVTLYGRNLLMCEELVTTLCQKYTIIRPSYIYGYSLGDLDNRTQALMKAVQGEEEVERFTNMYKSPLGVDQVADVILGTAALEENILIHASGERMSVYDHCFHLLRIFKQSTNSLIPTQIPKDKEGEMLPDTSLDNTFMKSLLKIEPESVEEYLGARELIDLVDEHNNIIGVTDVETAHEKKQLHRVVGIFLFDSDERLILQHKVSQDRWDISVGGHVKLSESYDDAAYREMKEELEVEVEILHLSTFLPSDAKRGHFWGLYHGSLPSDWIFLPTEEVATITTMPMEEVAEKVENSPEVFTAGFINAYREFIRLKNT
jgi:dTDP-4-dehydrorhamnose reductase